MTRHYTKWTKELLEPIVNTSYSYSQCLKQMNLRVCGGNYKNLQKNLDKFNIDHSHFLGQSVNIGKEFKPFENLLKPSTIKKRLIKERGHCCECCGLTEWMGKKLILELDHVNGNNRDNQKENLKLLCPNCHSQTPTWRNRKR